MSTGAHATARRRTRAAQLELEVYTSPMREVAGGGQFSPTTSTILIGPTEAVLVDAQFMEDDVQLLADRIEATGRKLTAIYITHAHADHYFGLDRLLGRFPEARAVALPAVASAIAAGHEQALRQWRQWFGGKALEPAVRPGPLEGGVIGIDNEELVAIEVGQGDIAPSAILHAPSIDAVVAGDVVYNGINPFLAMSTPEEWPRWIESLDRIASLEPEVVVAGHKRPELPDDDIEASVGRTRSYLRDFIEEFERSADSRELASRIRSRYPDLGNPTALVVSAMSAFKQRRGEA